jgi:hypothetical protein
MRRDLLVVLLLATGVSLAAQTSNLEHAAGSARAQAQTGAVSQQPKAQAQKQETPQKKAVHAEAAEAQPQAKATQQATTAAQIEKREEPQAKTDNDPKLTSVPGANALGMSILGNQDAPKALVIVPWKSSDVGRTPGISPMLDDSRQPVDKEVFMRALRYYEIKSQTKP